MTHLALPGEIGCPKRLWSGMARDACCAEQDAGLCPPGCVPGARAKKERRRYLAMLEAQLALRQRLGHKNPRRELRQIRPGRGHLRLVVSAP